MSGECLVSYSKFCGTSFACHMNTDRVVRPSGSAGGQFETGAETGQFCAIRDMGGSGLLILGRRSLAVKRINELKFLLRHSGFLPIRLRDRAVDNMTVVRTLKRIRRVTDFNAIVQPYFSKGRYRIVGGAIVDVNTRRATSFNSFSKRPHA